MNTRQVISELKAYHSDDVFNPWSDFDPDHDTSSRSPQLRLENLQHYLNQRIKTARWLLIAEAAGFRGCKFSGIAMTCERQLSDTSIPNKRTSCQLVPLGKTSQQFGVLEPTAMIVKRAMERGTIDPNEVVLWNTFAWHPHKQNNRLTNRTPRPDEIKHGMPALKKMLALMPNARMISIGKTSQRTLNETLGLETPAVRHPANGGAIEFTNGFIQLTRRS